MDVISTDSYGEEVLSDRDSLPPAFETLMLPLTWIKRLKGEGGGSGHGAVAALQGKNRSPERIQVDNGAEFIFKDLDKWAYENGVTLDFSKPEKLTEITH